MILSLAYLLATALIVAIGWRRGDFSFRLCAAIIGVGFIATNLIYNVGGLSVSMKTDAVFNGLILAPAAVYAWLRTGRVWPLGIMGLAILQVVAALDYSSGTHSASTWASYNAVMAAAYVAELLVLLIGPHARATVSLLLGRIPRLRRHHWRAGYVRAVTREKAR